ncbi:MAG: hypothetical protein WD226_04615 [Planctomycetota bacterium]
MASSTPFWLPVRRGLGRVRRSCGVDTFDVFGRAVRPEDAEFLAPSGYRFGWATPDEIHACDEYHTELDAGERARGVARLGFDHRAVIVHHGATAVFTMWVNPRNINTPGGIKRRLHADQVFIYKAFTSPEHRGKSLYKAGMAFVLADLAQRGLRELIGYAHVDKSVSRKGLARLDFTTKGRYWRVFAPGFEFVRPSRELRASFPLALAPSGVLDATAIPSAPV